MTVSDILVSPVRILKSAVGLTLPADSLAVGGSWPAGWTELGYTSTPLTAEYKFDALEYDIQESLASVGRAKTKESFTIETTLAEFNLDALSWAWDGALTITSASSAQVGKYEVTLGDTPRMTILQWGFEGNYVSTAGNAHPIRLFVWKATSVTGGKLEFGKAKETGITLQLSAISDMGKSAGQRLYKFQKVTAPAT